MKLQRDYLKDMLEYLDNIATFTSEGRQAFMNDLKTQLAVIRAYEVIGEISKRLPDTLRDTNPEINWRKLIGFRDFLAHNYQEIILEFVWDAVEDVLTLRAAVASILDSLPDEDE